MFHPRLVGPSYRFGAHPSKPSNSTLKFNKYATALPTPPTTINQIANCFAALGLPSNVTRFFPMDGNDTYGDCVMAAIAHAMTLWHGLIKTQSIMSATNVISEYFKLTGGVDSGLDLATTLNFWKTNTINGDEILTYVSIDPSDHNQVKQAIDLFGGVIIAFQVQQNATVDFETKTVWTPGNLTNDGHCVYVTGYTPGRITCLTWGSYQQGTWGWWDECVQEVYAILPPEAETTGFTEGFDFAQLKADLVLL